MAALNYTTPIMVTSNSPATTLYQSITSYSPSQIPHQGYSYPNPQKPLLLEEYSNNPFFQSIPHRQQSQPQPHTTVVHHPTLSSPIPQIKGPLKQNPLTDNQNVYLNYNTKVPSQPNKASNPKLNDYDYDYENEDSVHVPVTPIQGPIYLKNGKVPVVPLYSHPVINNGTFLQIPIWWTALSVVLGIEIGSDYIRGISCIKRYEQLYCPTAGNLYPLDRIEIFISDNKALMRRMYGEFNMPDYEYKSNPIYKQKRSTKTSVPEMHLDPDAEEKHFGRTRNTRQSFRNNQSSDQRKVDVCESKIEIVTPYWAANSAGKVRAIVNTQHFEQAIHQEVCSRTGTKRCTNDCSCEQKYKWHRLLSYDPDNDCKGIFMDWYLFPSCCVCRCSP